MKLGVNIDHIATIREARKISIPDVLKGAQIAIAGGADSITAHLREDRRHIQDKDIFNLKENISVPLNLEMATTKEMLEIAKKVKPAYICLVPEKRQEITTEGGLNVYSNINFLKDFIANLKEFSQVSIFIDPEHEQIEACKEINANAIEIHTGKYSNAKTAEQIQYKLLKIRKAAQLALSLGLKAHAGHGLNYDNIHEISKVKCITELNIGHAIIAKSIFIGLEQAVREMKQLIKR